MRRNRVLILALLAALSAASGAWARGGAAVPHRYSAAGLDGPLVQLQNPIDGRSWSFWAYRWGGQFDLAISSLRGDGSWSEPTFFGDADSLSQVDPAAVVDASGTVYLAFAVRETGQIFLATLLRGSDVWSAPVSIVREPGRHFLPTLRIVGRELVVAYRSGLGVGITVVPLAGGDAPTGIQDGPDTLPGHSGDGINGGR